MISRDILVNLIDDTSEEHGFEERGDNLLRLIHDAAHVWYGPQIEDTWVDLRGTIIDIGGDITAGSSTDTSMARIVISKIDLDDQMDHPIVEAPSLDVNAMFNFGTAFAGLGAGIGGAGSPDSVLPSFHQPTISRRHSAAIQRFGDANGSTISNVASLKRHLVALLELVNLYGHKPVLVFDEDEGSLELEVRINPDELLLVSVNSDGAIDGIIDSAKNGYISVNEKDVPSLLVSLRQPHRVMEAAST